LLFELRPAEKEDGPGPEKPLPGILQVEQDGLAAALRRQAAELARDGLSLKLDMAAYQRQAIEPEKVLYRIAQEALNNVVKHAQTQRAELALSSNGTAVSMIIQDAGRGFDPTAATGSGSPRGGFGLGNMRERAQALGGTVDIDSVPGGGTRIAVTLPVPAGQSTKQSQSERMGTS
jgi:signal transduction histidine kinase